MGEGRRCTSLVSALGKPHAVTRGSGDPSAIPEHAALFLKALHEYQTRLGHGLPPGEVARALDVTHEGGGGDAIGVALTRAENNIIGRALAVAAARQVNGSKTIAETRGEEQIQRGIDMQLRIIEGRRKEVASTRAVKPRKGRRKKRVLG